MERNPGSTFEDGGKLGPVGGHALPGGVLVERALLRDGVVDKVLVGKVVPDEVEQVLAVGGVDGVEDDARLAGVGAVLVHEERAVAGGALGEAHVDALGGGGGARAGDEVAVLQGAGP